MPETLITIGLPEFGNGLKFVVTLGLSIGAAAAPGGMVCGTATLVSRADGTASVVARVDGTAGFQEC